jgi:hypothetical protein
MERIPGHTEAIGRFWEIARTLHHVLYRVTNHRLTGQSIVVASNQVIE